MEPTDRTENAAQVELYTHGDTVRRILTRLGKWGCRLAAVHLIDAHHCR